MLRGYLPRVSLCFLTAFHCMVLKAQALVVLISGLVFCHGINTFVEMCMY